MARSVVPLGTSVIVASAAMPELARRAESRGWKVSAWESKVEVDCSAVAPNCLLAFFPMPHSTIPPSSSSPPSPPTPQPVPDANPPDQPLPTGLPSDQHDDTASNSHSGPSTAAGQVPASPLPPAVPSSPPPLSSSPPVASQKDKDIDNLASSSKLNGNGASKHSPPNAGTNLKPSVLSKFLRVLIPCAFPSPGTHQIDIDADSVTATGSREKQASVSTERVASNTIAPVSAIKELTPPSSPTAAEPVVGQDIIVPEAPPLAPEDIVVPSTPPPQLLPLEETIGVTSGAVQAPGSTGATPVEETKRHSRDSTPPSNVTVEEESESSSFTEDEDMDGLDDLDDEEKLIMNGGAGIPIGPVSRLKNTMYFFINSPIHTGWYTQTTFTPNCT